MSCLFSFSIDSYFLSKWTKCEAPYHYSYDSSVSMQIEHTPTMHAHTQQYLSKTFVKHVNAQQINSYG